LFSEAEVLDGYITKVNPVRSPRHIRSITRDGRFGYIPVRRIYDSRVVPRSRVFRAEDCSVATQSDCSIFALWRFDWQHYDWCREAGYASEQLEGLTHSEVESGPRTINAIPELISISGFRLVSGLCFSPLTTWWYNQRHIVWSLSKSYADDSRIQWHRKSHRYHDRRSTEW
jgi:hypothetical protein